MKKLLFGLFAMILSVSIVSAQDGVAALKNATKAMSKYQQETDSAKKATNLQEACAAIDKAADASDGIEKKMQSKLWQTRGEIYNEVVRMAVNKKVADANYMGDDLKKGLQAHEAFKKALAVGEKKWQKNEALEGMTETASYLSNAGRLLYGDKDYENALENFQGVTSIREVLNANGKNDVLLADDEAYNEHVFMTAITALSAKNNEVAQPLFVKLMEADYDKAVTYEGLFRTTLDKDADKALEYLAMGREKFPDDEGLRVAEINHYIQVGKLDVLVDKLKLAIEKDPNNISYYSVLGKVYDDLYQRESAEGNKEVASENFDNALTYYNQALEKDDKFFSALYNVGALYYNKAAILTKDLIALESDYSKEGTAKYKAKQTEVLGMFDKALPYFQKAEAVNAVDLSTLIALKEIYAKKDDLTMSNEFKDRIAKVEAGEEVKPYFN